MTDDAEHYRVEMTRRLLVLKQAIAEGRIQFAPDLAQGMQASLSAVRYSSDGLVDLSTVDGRVRSTALAMEVLHDRSELKAAMSLSQVQEMYFGLVFAHFGDLHGVMLERRLDPHVAAQVASTSPDVVEEVSRHSRQFIEELTDFWRTCSEVAHTHVEDSHSLKAVFGGDLFPSYHQNIASTCGLYVDTIVLPDPFIRSVKLFELWSPERRTYYFVKHALNLLNYRDIALADVSPPLVVVLPDRSSLEADSEDLLLRMGRADAVEHARAIFGRHFVSYDDTAAFLRGIADPDRLVAEVANPSRILFNTEWAGSVAEQMARALRDFPESRELGTKPGEVILAQATGRMLQANDLLLRTQRLRGVPLVDAPTSWRYLQWKLEYDTGRLSPASQPALHVTRALQVAAASGRIAWLGRVPPHALIELRRTGGLQELRTILGDGVERLASAAPSDFGQTADLVVANIEAALANYEAQLDAARQQLLKFGFKDVGSWLVVGGLEVTAAATGYPLYGLAALAGNQLLDIPKLKDFPAKVRALIEEGQRVRHSPVGVLFRYAD
jgi:hypothetical protein